jgi:hypothetical protein
MRYKLRTLMIVLAVGPVVLWGAWLGVAAVLAQIRMAFLARGIGT